jgi:tripartite-type tricarboxylate transporter receptor subunit TctC
VPATPGGAIDLAARLIGNKLTESCGQPVVIDNRPGAAGIGGSENVAKSAPDGYVLGLVASSHAINASLYSKLPYDTVRDFAPVASSGNGGAPHLLAELVQCDDWDEHGAHSLQRQHCCAPRPHVVPGSGHV